MTGTLDTIYHKFCPECATSSARDASRCNCGHVFNTDTEGKTLSPLAQSLEDEMLYEIYLKARVDQAMESIAAAQRAYQAHQKDANADGILQATYEIAKLETIAADTRAEFSRQSAKVTELKELVAVANARQAPRAKPIGQTPDNTSKNHHSESEVVMTHMNVTPTVINPDQADSDLNSLAIARDIQKSLPNPGSLRLVTNQKKKEQNRDTSPPVIHASQSTPTSKSENKEEQAPPVLMDTAHAQTPKAKEVARAAEALQAELAQMHSQTARTTRENTNIHKLQSSKANSAAAYAPKITGSKGGRSQDILESLGLHKTKPSLSNLDTASVDDIELSKKIKAEEEQRIAQKQVEAARKAAEIALAEKEVQARLAQELEQAQQQAAAAQATRIAKIERTMQQKLAKEAERSAKKIATQQAQAVLLTQERLNILEKENAILRKSVAPPANVVVQEKKTTPMSAQVFLKECPNCTAALPVNAVDCACGFSFGTADMETLTLSSEVIAQYPDLHAAYLTQQHAEAEASRATQLAALGRAKLAKEAEAVIQRAAAEKSKSCPHCTANVAVVVEKCKCGYAFPEFSSVNMPGLSLDPSDIAELYKRQ